MSSRLAWTPICLFSTLLLFTGCKNDGGPSEEPAPQGNCFSGTLRPVSGQTGFADVFLPDPMIASGRSDLAPGALAMDQYRKRVALERLGGRGVLEGQFVDVRDGLHCKGGFSAFSEANSFSFAHGDFRFQSAMTYYFADQYRSQLDLAGYLKPVGPVKMVVHCAADNNAYYVRYPGIGGQLTGEVCLGNSTYTRNTSYADDAAVIVHELQHATTVETYSPREDLNQFWYDEAGALNEAVSDFMSLMFLAPSVPATFDAKLFSRWALGTYLPNQRVSRGAHLCAAYDSDYPRCLGFPGFSARSNTISFVYPDGLGWPHARNHSGPGYLRSVFINNKAQEEIHTTGILLAGALWDVYEALVPANGVSGATRKMIQAVHQTLSELPKPTLSNRSPVTFVGFAQGFLSAAQRVGFTADDLAHAGEVLEARGLHRASTLEAGWAGVGAGDSRTPGMKVFDHPTELKVWLTKMGSEPKQVTQTNASLNGALSGGEVAAIWFDLANRSEKTAGSVYLRVRSMNPRVTFLDSRTNIGAISDSEAHIIYSKVNGTSIAQALSSPEGAYHVPTGASYFLTNTFFSSNWRTALWVRVADGPSNDPVVFSVEATPSNGPASQVEFQTWIQ